MAREISPHVGEMVEQILYLLWDIGFKVGHSTRSIKEAIAQANRDMLTKTAMLEARFLAGDAQLVRSFRKQFRSKCVVGFEREYVELRMQDQAARHAKFGNSVYMQEPNVKSGCGGLRDYQNLLWMTYFKEGALTTTHLVGKTGSVRPSSAASKQLMIFSCACARICITQAAARTDILHLSIQDQIAQRLQIFANERAAPQRSVHEGLLWHTRNIFRVTERITEQFASGRSSGMTRVALQFSAAETARQGKDFG